MPEIKNRLKELRQQIETTSKIAKKDTDSVTLLAVSKTWSASALRAAAAAGQRAFGENYLQEALSKKAELVDLDLTWHFIGPIQSNKTREIASQFDWVQSVDRLKIVQRLATQRPADLPPLNICIQLNIDDEPSKSGAKISELMLLAEAINTQPTLCLRGLMIIPTPTDDITQQRQSFDRAYTLFTELASRYDGVDTLSMGMSQDMTTAIEAGSTLVRIGSALFGKRLPKSDTSP